VDDEELSGALRRDEEPSIGESLEPIGLRPFAEVDRHRGSPEIDLDEGQRPAGFTRSPEVRDGGGTSIRQHLDFVWTSSDARFQTRYRAALRVEYSKDVAGIVDHEENVR
jgi:hypothetical protein